MTTRWRKKASSILAVVCVIALLCLIIFLWTAVKDGLFTTNHSNVYNKINISEKNDIKHIISGIKYVDINSSTTISSIISSNNDDSELPPLLPKDNEPPPSPASLPPEQNIEEFIKPTKIHGQPLHPQDLLYESIKTSDTKGKAPVHRITGQYRNKSSRIWDPHPEYLVDAFGVHLHLRLSEDASFISEDIKVTHVGDNETYRATDDDTEHDRLKGCFYKGVVRGDEHSSVSVSLCGGIGGHIYTSSGSFLIEPVEEYTVENPNVLHKITRAVPNGNSPHKTPCETCVDKECIHLSDLSTTTELPGGHNRRKRSLYQNNEQAFTMEILVAVDRKMLDYHGRHFKEYILTLMSIVSSIYADASIGNSIKIAVVEIIVLNETMYKKSDAVDGVSASDMLANFCRYMQKLAFHRDTALLLTREQICRTANEKKCDTLGLAELSTMCRPSSCAIVQDNGLSAAFTIAHEIGHVLSMPHDDDVKCARYRSRYSNHIMSRMLDHNTHPWSWSECSRHYVTEYLENNHGSCMLDRPKRDMIEPTKLMFAGERFSARQQCELVYGPGVDVCPYMPKCSRLWCGSEREGCKTQHMPWADGTECDNNKWCHHGSCVYRNRTALAKVNGGWGPWKEYDDCSRPCGGGVKNATRECNSPTPTNGGQYCVGKRIRYISCNTHNCPPDYPEFREKQCADLNNNSFDIQGITHNDTWIPKYGVSPADECKLYCRVETSTNYFLLGDKVIDGTSCTHDSFNKCVNGVCRNAGCDNKLDSNAKLDKCGVCEGQNSTCHDIRRSVILQEIEQKKMNGATNYYHITKIPKGASNIEIIQPGHVDDLNYIALVDDQGNYIVNGFNVITQYPRTFAYGGLTFEYTGTNRTIERVNTTFARRLKRDLIVHVLSRTDRETDQRNPNSTIMSYSYTISLADPNAMPYQWRSYEWSECSETCRGIRRRTVACVQTYSGQTTHSHNCRQPKPSDHEPCNENCVIEWDITRSECYPCGDGHRTLSFKCVRRITDSSVSAIIDDAYCSALAKPYYYEKCFDQCHSAEWTYSEWGFCSTACVQNRTAMCHSHSSNGYQIDNKFCSNIPKKHLEQKCDADDCPIWAHGEDSPCSVTCGEGVRSTKLHCTQNNQVVNPSVCNSIPRPVEITKKCTMQACAKKVLQPIPIFYVDETPPATLSNNVYEEHNYSTSTNTPQEYFRFRWRIQPWNACSVTCGEGIRTRNIQCVNAVKQYPVDDLYCPKNKPHTVEPCKAKRCPEWIVGELGDCNSNCKRQRQVVCQGEIGQIDEKYCSSSNKPKSFENCCKFKWRNIWTPCSCETGLRKIMQICMRLSPRSDQNPSPRKKGEKVANSYCANMPPPKFIPKMRNCTKVCNPPRWDSSPWSTCSVGCGQGYARRHVTCKVGNQIVDESRCKDKKPIKTKHCENKSDCLWDSGPWKNCTCNGITKRRVFCTDARLKRLSNNCDDQYKPASRKACIPPDNCSCKTLQERSRIRHDGEYDLLVKGKSVQIYCHNMNTVAPQEYITLKSRENYASYYSKLSRENGKCSQDGQNELEDTDKYLPSGTTYFTRIKINLQNLQVIEDDFEFTTTHGRHKQKYGTAGDCFSTTQRCARGVFSINLEKTNFRIRPKTEWNTRGPNSTIDFYHKLENPYQRVIGKCGGYCGTCFPSKSTGLHLEVL